MALPTDSTFRKIDLQASADVAFLARKLLDRADERVDEALPGRGTSTSKGASTSTSPPTLSTTAAATGTADEDRDDDPVRAAVRKQIHAWVAQVYQLVGPNVAINGLDVSPDRIRSVIGDDGTIARVSVVEEFEPVDAKLAAQLRKLEATKDSLTERVADLRRLGPATARDRWVTDVDRPDGLVQTALGGDTFAPPVRAIIPATTMTTTGTSTETTSTDEIGKPPPTTTTTIQLDTQESLFATSTEADAAALERARQSWTNATDSLVRLEKSLAEDLATARRVETVVETVQARARASATTTATTTAATTAVVGPK